MDAPLSLNGSIRIGLAGSGSQGVFGALTGREMLALSREARFLGKRLAERRDERWLPSFPRSPDRPVWCL
ncbi:MAG: hypothetical protein OXG58_10940 [Gemmatimonadetes bacterium]|nr:hypothetical protein [Gemmatimonadota bacterium]MCY3944312.1 hypothetical protein [Gemmatimonadota bacterium]